jgi:integrating conjugative element protein (TIGR03761 family)
MSASFTDHSDHPADDSLDFTSPEPLAAASDAGIPDIPVPGAGPLTDVEPDTMTLHTRDAYQMFVGRKHEPGSKLMPIVGGRTFAAVLKSIWYLSERDNPYADWILIQLNEGLGDFRKRLARVAREHEDVMQQLRRKGLALSVMSSRNPLIVRLGFRSPYGYATAEVMVEFDYYVRVIKTLVHKDRLSDTQGRDAIRALTRELRRFFLSAVYWERLLCRDELAHLSREDFLPGADAAACKRTGAAAALFGPVPQEILTGSTMPRHTRRRAKPTEAELRALRAVAQSAADETDRAAEALL